MTQTFIELTNGFSKGIAFFLLAEWCRAGRGGGIRVEQGGCASEGYRNPVYTVIICGGEMGSGKENKKTRIAQCRL